MPQCFECVVMGSVWGKGLGPETGNSLQHPWAETVVVEHFLNFAALRERDPEQGYPFHLKVVSVL